MKAELNRAFRAGLAVMALLPLPVWATTDINVTNPSVAEGNAGTTAFPFIITRSGDASSQIILQFQTEDGTATAPSDYVSLYSTNLTISTGTSSATVNVTVNGDTAPESDENFFLHLTSAVSIGFSASFGTPVGFSLGNEPSSLPNHHWPWSVALGDINGDGKQDLVVGNSQSGDVSVLLNTTVPGAAAPSFAAASTFNVGTVASTAVLCDINGDGKLDIVVPNRTATTYNGVAVLLNTTATGASTATFTAASTFGTGNNGAGSVVAGDLNGDGRRDLAFAGNAGLSVLLNTTVPGSTNPSFAAVTAHYTTGSTGNVVMVDINGDGKLDLAADDNQHDTVVVLLNTTTPNAAVASFAAASSFAVGALPAFIATADINGDGKPDLATANSNSFDTSVLLNTTPTGATVASFTAAMSFGPIVGAPESVSLGDINGDGRSDLLVTDSNTNGASLTTFLNATRRGAGAPSFAAPNYIVFGAWLKCPVLGDVNGDGRPDLVVADYDPSVDVAWVLLNTTAFSTDLPGFAAAGSFGTGTNPVSAVLGDLNGDGVADLAVANQNSNNVSVLLSTTTPGAGTASFAGASNFGAGTGPSSVALRDFNGDGKPDVVVANGTSNNVSVLLNTTAPGAAAPGFSSASNFGVGANPRSVVTGDLNGDGVPDVAVANGDSNNVSVLLNSTTAGAATPSFAAAGNFAVGTSPVSIALADINGDGKSDLVIANSASNNISALLNNTAPGATAASFASASSFLMSAGCGPTSVALGDINGDGNPDIAVACSAGNATVLLNTTTSGATTPTFTAAGSFTAGTGPISVLLSDVNNDGKLDLVVVNGTSNNVSVLLNTTAPGASTASFAATRNTSTGTGPRSVAVGDINSDGQTDLLVVNGGSNNVSALLNGMFAVNLLSSQGTGTILDDDSDRIPNVFVFTDQSDVAPSTLIVSNSITVSGINAPAPVSVTGGEYSIDGGPFTSASGTVANLQTVRVRVASSSAYSATTVVTLIIGGVSGTFQVTTLAAPSSGGGGGGGALYLLESVAGLLLSLFKLRRRKRSDALRNGGPQH